MRIKLEDAITYYIILMVFGMAITSLAGLDSAFLWMFNIGSFLLTIFPFCHCKSREILLFCLLFLISNAISVMCNLEFITTNLKTIGIHVNICIFIAYIFLYSRVKCNINHDYYDVRGILKALSVAGLISFVFSLFYDYHSYELIVNGGGVYSNATQSFFNNKNSYGIFLAISCVSDLYLRAKNWCNKKYIYCSVAIKIVGVTLSFSRAALLFLIIVLSITILRRMIKTANAAIGFLLTSTVCASLLINNARLCNFAINKVLRLEVGDAGRSVLRDRALDVVGNFWYSILFGVGYAGVSELEIDIDNAYLYEFFVGGVVRVLFVIIILLHAIKMLLDLKLMGEFDKLSLTVLFGYLVYAFFESYAPLELGLGNFCFLVLIVFIPLMNRSRLE